MHRRFLLVLTALTLGAGPVGAATFGGLTITPRGAQNLDLQTGYTELPGGGTATDSRTGLRLNAGRMQLRPGERLVAQNVTVTTRQGGTLRADHVTYDLAGGAVTATGGVTYSDGRLRGLRAGRLALHTRSGVVSAHGSVRVQLPRLEAAALAWEAGAATGSGRVLLAGPAQVGAAAPVGPGSRLLLTFRGGRLSTPARPDAATTARLTPYLRGP